MTVNFMSTDPGWFIHQMASPIDPWLNDLHLSYLWFSTFYSSSFGRTETIVFAKKNKILISNMPPGLFSPAPPPSPTFK